MNPAATQPCHGWTRSSNRCKRRNERENPAGRGRISSSALALPGRDALIRRGSLNPRGADDGYPIAAEALHDLIGDRPFNWRRKWAQDWESMR